MEKINAIEIKNQLIKLQEEKSVFMKDSSDKFKEASINTRCKLLIERVVYENEYLEKYDSIIGDLRILKELL